MRSTTTSGHLFRALLLVALGTALAFGCCACAGEYVNENGPRGPEHVRWGPGWPRQLAPCEAAPK